MRSEVVEDDRPGGSASASPAGKSKRMPKVKIPKARPMPRQWEGEMMSCYPIDSQWSQQGHFLEGSASTSPTEER